MEQGVFSIGRSRRGGAWSEASDEQYAPEEKQRDAQDLAGGQAPEPVHPADRVTSEGLDGRSGDRVADEQQAEHSPVARVLSGRSAGGVACQKPGQDAEEREGGGGLPKLGREHGYVVDVTNTNARFEGEP